MKLNKFKSSEITPENFYINRRQFLKEMGIITGTAFASQNVITSALSYTCLLYTSPSPRDRG